MISKYRYSKSITSRDLYDGAFLGADVYPYTFWYDFKPSQVIWARQSTNIDKLWFLYLNEDDKNHIQFNSISI